MTPIAWASWPERIAAWLLFAAVALAPLPFGSSQSIAIAFWCIVLGASLVFAPVRSLGAGQLALAGVAGVVVAAYALVLHEQLAEHPWLPGAIPHPIWRETEKALGVPLVPLVSIARTQPWLELGRPLVCMLAISCGFLVGADAGRARQLIKIIAWSGAAYAAYGILAHLFDPAHILWRDKEAYLNSVTGTFINRNTAGAYFGSCAVVWSLLLWERARREMPPGPLDWPAMFVRLSSGRPKKVVVSVCNAAFVSRGNVHDRVARCGCALAVRAHCCLHHLLLAAFATPDRGLDGDCRQRCGGARSTAAHGWWRQCPV